MLILASESRYRRQQLEQLGLRFEAEASGVDEAAFKSKIAEPRTLALALSRAKAETVARRRHPSAVVIGGDQLVDLDGEVLGKPGSAEAAIAQLMRMRGRTHVLWTAVCVGHGERFEAHVDRTELKLRDLDEASIRRYVALDEPYDCAGSYKIERGGIALFEGVQSTDPSAITGLPLIAVVTLLRRFGVAVP